MITCLNFQILKEIDDKCLNNSEEKIESMDIKVGLKIGTKCSYLTKFYGALHAEVKI
jgi:hypothetical protein